MGVGCVLCDSVSKQTTTQAKTLLEIRRDFLVSGLPPLWQGYRNPDHSSLEFELADQTLGVIQKGETSGLASQNYYLLLVLVTPVD